MTTKSRTLTKKGLMTTKLQEAVDYLGVMMVGEAKTEATQHIRTLIEWGEKFLAVKGMPEKRDVGNNFTDTAIDRWDFGRNQAIDLCTLAHIKAVPSEQEILNMLWNGMDNKERAKNIHDRLVKGVGDE